MSQTSPSYSQVPPPAGQLPRKKTGGFRRALSSTLLVFLMIACVLVAALGIGGLGGAYAGERERNLRATQTLSAGLEEQFALGMENFEAGRYELAAERFRFILSHDPDHPAAANWLAETERRMSGSGSSGSGEPVATLPPPDTEDPDELFAEAQGYYGDQQWENAITRLQELQALDPSYRTSEVNEMIYNSIISLGMYYLREERLEEGLFLLEQAATYRPLSDQVEGERRLATLYINGRTYWDLYWPVVIDNLAIIVQIAPNYLDTAERLWEARVAYGDQLLAGAEFCEAAAQYLAALNLRQDAELQTKYDAANRDCGVAPDATAGPTPTYDPAVTPTPTLEPGVDPTPTPEWNIP